MEVFTNVMEYAISCLPVDHPDHRHYSIRVVRRGQKWMAWDGARYLNAAGEWSMPQMDDLWWKARQFSRAEALDLAYAMAPKMECNGRSVEEVAG